MLQEIIGPVHYLFMADNYHEDIDHSNHVSIFPMTNLLRLAYIANLLILGPALVSMFCDGSRPIRTFQGRVENCSGNCSK